MDKFEKQITAYVADLTYDSLTRSAVQSAKERYLDSLAVAFAAYREPPVEALRHFAMTASSAKGAAVLGTAHKAPVDYATVYVGTMIRALDWNDTYLNREPAHPSDNIAACLALAEAEGRTGKDLILATVVAYELQCRLCDAAGIRKKGWDHVTYGSVSSASAAAKLMGFPTERIRDTIAIAVTTGNYLRQTRIGSISQWKAAAFAQAAQNAVRAALYVKHGMTGPCDIFLGKHGLINQITQGEFDLAARFGGQDGEPFKIDDTYIKYFPAEYHSQSAIWSALALRKTIGPARVKDIARVRVDTSFHSYDIIGREPAKWKPDTKETADHSMPYIVAAALMDGDIALEQFEEKRFRDPELLALVQKVEVAEKKEYTDIYGKSFPNKVAVAMKDGNVFEQETIDPKGHPSNPLTPGEIEDKFRTATAPVFSGKRQEEIIKMIWGLDELKDIGALARTCEVK